MRTYEESCDHLDQIVGRCIREETFAEEVLKNPELALVEYGLSQDEMDDFRALRDLHKEEAREGWSRLRAVLVRKETSLEPICVLDDGFATKANPSKIGP